MTKVEEVAELVRYKELMCRQGIAGAVYTPEEEKFINYMEDKRAAQASQYVIPPSGLDLMELCVGYFWDRFVECGGEDPDSEYLLETLGVTMEELEDKFKILGFEEE